MRDRPITCFYVLFAIALCVGCTSKPSPTDTATSEPINASSFMSIIETLTSAEMEGRDAGTDGIDLARDYIVADFKAHGLQPAFVINGKPSYTQPLTLRTGKDDDGEVIRATVENVGALLPGVGDLADQVVVIGGHYDHIGYGHYGSRAPEMKGHLHPGADDNASGTAGVMLLARHFALESKRNLTQPRRTIFFTGFAAEERGLIGSRYMVRNPDQWAFDAEQVSGMINLDMIGRLRGQELYVFTDSTGKEWRDWINAANESIGLDIKWDVRAPGGSDHSMFIAGGMPAVFFNTWLHDDYHTPRDTADKINAEGGSNVVRVVAHLTERAATAPERITFVPPAPRPPRPYLGVRLGSADKGVLAESILDDGPLDKAGVQAGDLLIAIAGNPVNSAGDIRSFLAKAKPGTEVVVTIQRGDETMDKTVLLGIRR
jgi:hypothetical protein